MKFLRTISTQRLLALIAGVVVAIAGGTAIAVAATSGGPVPRHEPLAKAVRGALTAPSVQGVSARITFTNNLINASDFQGTTDPILQGASGRLWYSTRTGQLRIELQSDNGDGQVVVNGNRFWVYDPASNTAYEGTLPMTHAHKAAHQKREKLLSVAQIQSDLNKLAKHLDLSGAIPGDIAGQPSYTLRVSPKHDGGLLGNVQLAWDAVNGVPLRFAIYANGDSTPVLELTASDISFGAVSSSVFAISPPAGAKIVKVVAPSGHQRRHARRISKRSLGFSLAAPKTLVGLHRHSVTLLDWSGSPAALVTYGQNLGGIAVVEQSARSAGKLNAGSASGDHGLSLPTVSIDGASGQELATALGTMVRFTQGSVTYTVLGSVPPAAAEAAARAL